MTEVIKEMKCGMEALVTEAFIPHLISLITSVMRGAMKEMKCGMKSVEGPAVPKPAQAKHYLGWGGVGSDDAEK